MSPRIRGLAIALGVAAALLLALRAALPFAAAWALRAGVERATGLPVEVDDVDLGLVRGTLVLEGLRVGRPSERDAETLDPERAVLRWERARARLAWPALLRREIRLRELAFERPTLRLVREADGRIEPLAGIASAGEEGAAEPARATEPAEPGWRVVVDRFALRGARLVVTDAAAAAERSELLALSLDALELADVRATGLDPGADRVVAHRGEFRVLAPGGPVEGSFELEALDVTRAEGQRFPLRVAVSLGSGTLALSADVGLRPFASDGRLSWRNLSLAPLVAAAREPLGAWVRAGRSAGQISLEVRATSGPEGEPAGIRVAGRASLREVDLRDPESDELALSWSALDLEAREVWLPFEPGTPRVSLARVGLAAPALAIARPTGAWGRLRVALGAGPPSGAGDGDTAGEGRAALASFTVETAALAGGTLELRDRSVAPPATVRLAQVTFDAPRVEALAPSAESLALRAVLPDAAPLAVDGRHAARTGRFDLSLDRLALPPFDGYAREVGFALAGGTASLRGDVRIGTERTAADTTLVLADADLAAVEDASFQRRYGMSLPLALALLRDPSGEIRLPVQVSVDQGAARVDAGAVVQGALRQAIASALQSPLRAVGALGEALGGGDDAPGRVAMEPVPMIPGRAAPALDAADRLDRLERLLAERPRLGVELRGRAGPADRPPSPDPAPDSASEAETGEPPLDPAALARARASWAAERLRASPRVEEGQVRVGPPAPAGAPAVLLALFAR